MSDSKRVRVSVRLHDTHHGKMDTVVERMKDNGFELDKYGKLEAIGVVTGSVLADHLNKLKTVEGVSAVEEERTDYKAL
jgi:hypothetical protein